MVCVSKKKIQGNKKHVKGFYSVNFESVTKC